MQDAITIDRRPDAFPRSNWSEAARQYRSRGARRLDCGGPIPAIVSQEQFDVIQEKLKHNQSIASRNNTKHQYLLRAMVSCGLCHLARTGRTTDTGHACNGKRPLLHPECLAQALQRAQEGRWLPQELQERRENLRKARVSFEHQMERLTEAYLAGVVPQEEYKRRRHELERRLEGLATQMRQLEASANKHLQLAGSAQPMEDLCQRVRTGLEQASFEQKRQLIELLIERVMVTNEEVEIRYVIPTSASSEHTRFCHLRSNYFDDTRHLLFLLRTRDALKKCMQLGQSIGRVIHPQHAYAAACLSKDQDVVMLICPVHASIPSETFFVSHTVPESPCPYIVALEARLSHHRFHSGISLGERELS